MPIISAVYIILVEEAVVGNRLYDGFNIMTNFKYLIFSILFSIPCVAAAEGITAVEALKSYAGDSFYEISIPEAAAAEEVQIPELRSDGESLFQELHRKSQPKNTHGYNSAKGHMYGTVDQINCQGKKGIYTFYSLICAYGNGEDGNSYHEQGDQNGDGVVDKIVNAEHLWPQSFFNKATPMVSDLHHIQSTFSTPNGRRSNYRFCETSTSKYATRAGSKLSSAGDCFEPADAVKGNVARAMLYFVTVYYDKNIRQGDCDYKSFWKDNVEMFLKWNRQDPPDEIEKYRNEMIYQYQGNRNPYVDDYTLADKIGANVFKNH